MSCQDSSTQPWSPIHVRTEAYGGNDRNNSGSMTLAVMKKTQSREGWINYTKLLEYRQI